MNKMNISRLALGVLSAIALTVIGAQTVNAQNSYPSHMHKKHSESYYRNHYSSNVVIGGSWGSQSGYNDHQHHNLIPHRKYYTYEGNQYYIDLDTGIRFQI